MTFSLKNLSRFISFALSLAMVLCLSAPVSSFAAENTDFPAPMIPLEESDISFEEAIEILGLTPEEAEKVQLYVVESGGDLASTTQNNGIQTCAEITDSSRTYINSGEVFNPGYFTFTNTNTGRYRTLNGDKVMLAFVWKPTSTNLTCQMTITFKRYGKSYPVAMFYPQNWYPNENGYQTSQTGWIDIERGWDYNIIYEAFDISYYNPQTIRVATIIAVY